MKRKYIQRSNSETYFFILLSSFLSLLLVTAFSSLAIHLIAVWLLCVVAIIVVNGDVLHPYCWFSVVLSLYSTSYAILLAMGWNGNYSKEQLLYPVIAISVALLFIGPHCETELKKKIKSNSYDNKNSDNEICDFRFLDYFITALSVVCLILSFILLRSGYSGKSAMKQDNNISYRIGVYAVRYLVIFTIIRVLNCLNINKKYGKHVVLTAISTLCFSLFTGERDVFIRFVVVLFFLLYSSGKIKQKHFLLLVPLSMVLLTLSVQFKYFFLRGTINGSFSLDNLLEGFLSSDFSAAGRNLQYLIDRPWTKGYFGYKMIVTELFYPIIPGSFKTNPDYWFNYVVHSGGYHGNAFTLVGTGYIIAGIPGIVIIFAIVGGLVKYLYIKASENIFYYSAYIYCITIVMISIRGSLNSIVNCFVKEVLVCFILCKILNDIFYRNKQSSNYQRNRRQYAK